MGNRFLRILRKAANQLAATEINDAIHHKPYSELTHHEYVSEVTYLMDQLGVPRLPAASINVFVHINKVA